METTVIWVKKCNIFRMEPTVIWVKKCNMDSGEAAQSMHEFSYYYFINIINKYSGNT